MRRFLVCLVLGASAAVTLLGCSEDQPGAGTEQASAGTCSGAACTESAPATAPAELLPPTTVDGQKNGDETDADCGGGKAPPCADGLACAAASDCASSVCTDKVCQAPSPDDKVKNGDESDVDCGGTKAPKCDVGKACLAHSDCQSDGCGYDGKCALARSCAGHFGGDTCGAGEVGAEGATHESCCASAPVSTAENAGILDKYKITAGRFRQFVERTNGNLRAFAEGLKDENPEWKSEWNDKLPSSVEEANFLLGPTGSGSRSGCDLGDSKGRTYWMSDEENAALGETGGHLFSKEELDQKALNCVEFPMLQAFCIWDGGRLAKQAEIEAAWRGGEERVYPWGNTWDASKVVYLLNYSFPEVYDKGNWVYIAAPGRRPEGNGKFGHADLAGLLFEITSDLKDGNVNWSGAGSWEGHGVSANGVAYGYTSLVRAYWATGGRCARLP